MKRVIVIAGGAIYVLSSLDTIIKEAVETYGAEIIRAGVRLDRVEIDAASGAGALGGLKVGNPEGFETPSAFELGEISLTLDVGTLTGDAIVIRGIAITAPHVTYEIGPGATTSTSSARTWKRTSRALAATARRRPGPRRKTAAAKARSW